MKTRLQLKTQFWCASVILKSWKIKSLTWTQTPSKLFFKIISILILKLPKISLQTTQSVSFFASYWKLTLFLNLIQSVSLSPISLYLPVTCPSVHPSVRLSVRLSLPPDLTFCLIIISLWICVPFFCAFFLFYSLTHPLIYLYKRKVFNGYSRAPWRLSLMKYEKLRQQKNCFFSSRLHDPTRQKLINCFY
jgi:hypothetical protein